MSVAKWDRDTCSKTVRLCTANLLMEHMHSAPTLSSTHHRHCCPIASPSLHAALPPTHPTCSSSLLAANPPVASTTASATRVWLLLLLGLPAPAATDDDDVDGS
jgi:hypothetical protein